MNASIGFSAILADNRTLTIAKAAQARVLARFPQLDQISLNIGETSLELWGHKELADCIHTMPDGSILALIGSPIGKISWQDVASRLLKAERPEDFELPWDGRVVLLRISADGKHWTMWNDWLGSIPVFHANLGSGRIASTLEPVTVVAARFTPDDFFMTGLVSLLINGNFLSDWTLFKGMRTVPPDCVAEWTDRGFHGKQLWTVMPSEERWETGWDDLVDEMYALSHQAIADTLKTQITWILPLSSGLDSRLIAAVGAKVGADLRIYAWGNRDSTDVAYSRQIARTLGYSWKHIELSNDFLITYTPQWADLFGSAMPFHGMYQMCFLDKLRTEPSAPVLSGFLGDVLAGSSIVPLTQVHATKSYQLENDWYTIWSADQVRSLLKFPAEDALEANAQLLQHQIESLPGAWFQKLQYLELWNRQRTFTGFQSILLDYWRGAATPYLNRAYARFFMSLPRVALDHRRLMGDVYRRYYGTLAVIPGTYADEPLIRTGRYLIKRRIVRGLPRCLQRGVFADFDNVPLRMDMISVRATGKAALWPVYEVWDQLAEWLNLNQLRHAYQAVMNSVEDIRPLRKLQSVQTLAYRLLKT